MATNGRSVAPFPHGGIGGMVRIESDWPFFLFFLAFLAILLGLSSGAKAHASLNISRAMQI